jgi:hypothetical protein
LLNPDANGDCSKMAMAKYRSLTAMSGDAREKYRDDIPAW